VESAKKLALALLDDFEKRGYLGGQYDEVLNSSAEYSCLTGDAQMAIVLRKLADREGGNGDRFARAALRLNRQVMHCQDLDALHPGVRGGVPGSCPMSGSYIRFGYPNWAAKFLSDALLLEIKSPHQGFKPAG
jgi:hypothetical protein